MRRKPSYDRSRQPYDGVVLWTALLGIAGSTWLAFVM
jgi:hypothetical protein